MRWKIGFKTFSPEDYRIAREVMEKMGIADLANQRFGNLSGGQKQRVLIARALACKPQILILDEPTANLDSRIEKDVYDLLKELNKDITIILVSHDIAFISHYISKVAVLTGGLCANPLMQ